MKASLGILTNFGHRLEMFEMLVASSTNLSSGSHVVSHITHYQQTLSVCYKLITDFHKSQKILPNLEFAKNVGLLNLL